MRGKENKYISPQYFYKIEKRFWIIPIEDLGFSVRAYNVLKNMKVSNLGDIIKMSELDLIMQRNCGEKTISEIKVLLCKYEIESQKK
jgi:DNA-directed RNA polymerase alpha subunit